MKDKQYKLVKALKGDDNDSSSKMINIIKKKGTKGLPKRKIDKNKKGILDKILSRINKD